MNIQMFLGIESRIFEEIVSIDIVIKKIEKSVKALSFKEISSIEKILLSRVDKMEFKGRIKNSIVRIKGKKAN